jgi:RNA polymerase sigma-70 factor (ECF subfamily)
MDMNGTGGSTAVATATGEAQLEDLMIRYQQADREAAAEFVRRVSPLLLRLLSGPLRTRGHVDDMLQECWLRIHKARHTFRPGSPVLPWVFAIARHTRVDVYRRRRRIDARELAVERLEDPHPPVASSTTSAREDLWQLVGRLPAAQQEVLQLLKVSGMSLEEVARIQGTSVGAVKQKAHRAYRKLRLFLQEEGGRKSRQ